MVDVEIAFSTFECSLDGRQDGVGRDPVNRSCDVMSNSKGECEMSMDANSLIMSLPMLIQSQIRG